MEEMTYDMEKVDDVMPGFRFHPTDEELVNFYLKRKVQQKSLPIELIKQVDIYKYDPWDLPRLASSGEKEWYFYCPRDRKYKNSERPNRVRKGGFGFWKATGTDKAIYSTEGKCIGLKKSLVFYLGKASKAEKTDWMMHEFRLPSISVSSPSKRFSTFSPNDSWAICRIFMKAKSSNNVQKALSHPWISQLPGSMVFDLLTKSANYNQFSSENIGSSNANNNNKNFSVLDIPTTYTQQVTNNSNTNSKPSQINVSTNGDFGDNLIFQTLEATSPTKCIYDATSLLSNTDFIGFEETNQQFSGFSISLPNDMQTNEWESAGRTIGFPFNLSPNDAWM